MGKILHPVQQAMVDQHGSQCGFCTPGIVMSLFALYHRSEPATRASVCDQLAGNLCRCTGYRPIVEAALDTCAGAPADRFAARGRGQGAGARGASPTTAICSSATRAPFSPRPPARLALAALYDKPPGRDPGRRRHRRRPVDHQAIARSAQDHLARPRRRARPDGGRRPKGSISMRRPALSAPCRSSPSFIPISAKSCAASDRRRCAFPARSAAISPMARRSATCRRR